MYPERMLRNIDASHGLTFSGSVLLALVEAGLSREAAYAHRAAQRDARVRGGAAAAAAARGRSPRPRRCSIRLRSIASSTWTPRCATRASRSTAWRQLMSSSLALDHLASGKVRELYDAGEGRLLLVASDRISAFDVVLPTPIPDKGRVLTALSLYWFALTADIVPQPRDLGQARGLPRGRARPELPARACSCGAWRCCRSSAWCAATWRAPAGRTTRRHRRGLRHPAAGRAARGRPAAAPLFTPPPRRPAATTRTSRPSRRVELVGERALHARSSARRSRSTGARPRTALERGHHPRRHEVRVRRRQPTASWCSATRC